MGDPDMTVKEVAARLRVSEWTIGQWLRAGTLTGYRLGGRRAGWRIEAADLEQFIEQRKGTTHARETER